MPEIDPIFYPVIKRIHPTGTYLLSCFSLRVLRKGKSNREKKSSNAKESSSKRTVG
jgi:hypothetical protein